MSAADLIAVLRAVAVVPIAWAIAADQRLIALGLFVLAALSDALDGWLARRSGNVGPRGALIDPLADKILVIGTLGALTAVGTGWPVAVVTALTGLREGVVAVFRVRAFARGVALPAERIAKLKTAAQMIGVALIIVGERPWPVAGAALVGMALLVSLVTLPRYFATRIT
ncbi:MAG TPA: CDP-alcohol phosphatidyltransferase family protein [Candidatus Limnocylindria bacterium]|nr:CDP-alcohol phosphatidyltransferase family protein [Candidatus Limnocylindria bacterium]